MQILAHRGIWLSPAEKNSRGALLSALESGFGIETDIRDLDGELVISHDMPGKNALLLKTLLEDYRRIGSTATLALNIKSDGLTLSLDNLLKEYGVSNYFCFDMSVPDMLHYIKQKVITASRISELEPEGILSKETAMIWVDGFNYLPYSIKDLMRWLTRNKSVCLVSPELHGRDPKILWTMLKQLPEALLNCPRLMICTDHPELAREFFK
ncbi:PI-PLC domain-containing protein [Lelliottia wanjuensis]|uniref:Phosphodiesterase n=1 Tax=Lelliottia wanjuensis TaxID=3050585 RepID=A0AAP4FXI0_9ENTR|nr:MULTISPECIES: hypothetical protein [unclassified Lelliottia]MDK9365410.1 hypothetical protein [Lelliottia sp. V106_12]MDK9584433.1 hypothetical protein [Lelliottia sp. V86_10]MDK9617238.1 hypothetical protein [Lelliottia sp. V106_9]